MIIYKDRISGDEVCNDSFPKKVVDDFYYEFTGTRINVDNNVSDALIGGNASAEEAPEDCDGDAPAQVIDIIYCARLHQTAFSSFTEFKKFSAGHLKAIKKKLMEISEERANTFMTKVVNFYNKQVKPEFEKYDFYQTESMDENGLIILCYYGADANGDETIPTFIAFKESLEEEKQ